VTELNVMSRIHIDKLTGIIIDLAIKIHTKIGPGCLEKAYEEILYRKLIELGFKVERQLLLPISFEEITVPDAYKLDLLVEDMLIVELKSLHPLPPVYFKQVRTQLGAMRLKNGLLLNFMVEKMKDGIYRIFNNHRRLTLLER